MYTSQGVSRTQISPEKNPNQTVLTQVLRLKGYHLTPCDAYTKRLGPHYAAENVLTECYGALSFSLNKNFVIRNEGLLFLLVALGGCFSEVAQEVEIS